MLLPSFKSILDYAILAYIHIMYEIDMPFINGPKEPDDIMILSKIVRRCGGYIIDPNNLKSKLY